MLIDGKSTANWVMIYIIHVYDICILMTLFKWNCLCMTFLNKSASTIILISKFIFILYMNQFRLILRMV